MNIGNQKTVQLTSIMYRFMFAIFFANLIVFQCVAHSTHILQSKFFIICMFHILYKLENRLHHSIQIPTCGFLSPNIPDIPSLHRLQNMCSAAESA